MGERKRATGFVLMDAAFAADRKFLQLYRVAATPRDFAAAVGVFWLILGDARRAKSPVVNWPDFDEYAPEVEALRRVRLLREDGFDPETFERWAPAYRAPTERTGTNGYGGGRKGTSSTNTSGQVSSIPESTTNPPAGAREELPSATFMGFRPKTPLQPGEAATPVHDGSHPKTCLVCHPVPREAKA